MASGLKAIVEVLLFLITSLQKAWKVLDEVIAVATLDWRIVGLSRKMIPRGSGLGQPCK